MTQRWKTLFITIYKSEISILIIGLSFVERTHQNPGAVTGKLERWATIVGTNLIQKTIEKQMDITYEQMYKLAPVKTGYLRSTIKVNSGGGPRDAWAQITVTARYAYYVHAGMSPKGRRTADPFWSTSIAGLAMETIVVVRNLFASQF